MILNKFDIAVMLSKGLIWLLAFVAPFYETMLSLLALIMLDFISGVWKVYKLKGMKEVTSFGMRKSVSKIFGYLLFIVAGVIAESMVPGQIPFMRLVIGFIAMIELKSISENVGEVLGINLWQYVRKVLDKTTGSNKQTEKPK